VWLTGGRVMEGGVWLVGGQDKWRGKEA
jgi:hypothetical protein